MKHFIARQLTWSIAVAILIFQPPNVYADGLIEEVLIDNPQLDLSQGTTTISFTLAELCKVNLFICDVKGNIVRNLLTDAEMTQGDHMEMWDGTDEYNSQVESGVYFPILQAKSKKRGTFAYNPTAEPWGEQIIAPDISYDAKSQKLSFEVDQMTYGRLRVGLKEGGPVYKTLAPWQLWQPGTHTLEWNGKDVRNYQSVLKKEKLSYSFDAFSLPPNSITVIGVAKGESLDHPEYQQFAIHPPRGGRLSYFSLEADSQEAEPELAVSWQNSKEKKGRVVLKGKAVCTVSFAAPNKKASALRAGSELILYLDDTYVIETPIDSLPASIAFDTGEFSNGRHVVTINLLTSDDRAGISLQNVMIKN